MPQGCRCRVGGLGCCPRSWRRPPDNLPHGLPHRLRHLRPVWRLGVLRRPPCLRPTRVALRRPSPGQTRHARPGLASRPDLRKTFLEELRSELVAKYGLRLSADDFAAAWRPLLRAHARDSGSCCDSCAGNASSCCYPTSTLLLAHGARKPAGAAALRCAHAVVRTGALPNPMRGPSAGPSSCPALPRSAALSWTTRQRTFTLRRKLAFEAICSPALKC